ncbi:hypothetical protein CC1G_15726 [Coprinopsis cinerea okayama7|uniref:Uncharacterized protein n=1 Tax=Coprinopsis cinerea (strain Okayama-7 / 130 / ATCC MYA-4618 / FGSC 9003) TaxID=240176 RepID=D6RQ85_COPC7|nr:hypothetical protein CC1G_15726 [Coprinopsis cinerea okayama7\|eukprot:XP_002910297.1 hypothetical protein CC1G_15726 [Coprinopsis cinerea okayama7\
MQSVKVDDGTFTSNTTGKIGLEERGGRHERRIIWPPVAHEGVDFSAQAYAQAIVERHRKNMRTKVVFTQVAHFNAAGDLLVWVCGDGQTDKGATMGGENKPDRFAIVEELSEGWCPNVWG